MTTDRTGSLAPYTVLSGAVFSIAAPARASQKPCPRSSTPLGNAPWRTFLIRLLLLVTCSSSVARLALAQEEPPEPDAAQPAAGEQWSAFTEETLDTWAFLGQERAAARVRFERLLVFHIDYLARTCRTSSAQKRKIQLAGWADIKHFFDAIDARNRRFRLAANKQEAFSAIASELEALGSSFREGFLAEKSLYGKILAKTLSAEQWTAYQAGRRRSRALRHRAVVREVVEAFGMAAGLLDAEKARLADLLLQVTCPLEGLPAGASEVEPVSAYELEAVLVHTSYLPEEKLRPLFSDAHWKTLSVLLHQTKYNFQRQ